MRPKNKKDKYGHSCTPKRVYGCQFSNYPQWVMMASSPHFLALTWFKSSRSCSWIVSFRFLEFKKVLAVMAGIVVQGEKERGGPFNFLAISNSPPGDLPLQFFTNGPAQTPFEVGATERTHFLKKGSYFLDQICSACTKLRYSSSSLTFETIVVVKKPYCLPFGN